MTDRRRNDLEPGVGALTIPVALGLSAGLGAGVVSLFTLGRLTIAVLHGMGAAGVVVNAVLGALVAMGIGFGVATLTARRARARGVGVGRAARTGMVTAVASVLGTVGLGMTAPLHLLTWTAHVLLGFLAAWAASSLSR